MSTAVVACHTDAGAIRERLEALGWEAVVAPEDAVWDRAEDCGADLVVAEVGDHDWRERLDQAHEAMGAHAGLKVVFLAADYPLGFASEAMDGAQSVPLVRVPCPSGALEQSIAAAD
jgi:hypothetical protein